LDEDACPIIQDLSIYLRLKQKVESMARADGFATNEIFFFLEVSF
jgi:hypothetical protein